MSLDEYFGDWMKVIDKSKLNPILNFLNTEYKRKPICPKQEDVFRAFRLCPYNDLKIIMLGQDPYPQKEVATGILFGNNKEIPTEDLSPSLQIIKEAVINLEIPHNYITFDPTLESWAKQGILLINSSLTVEMNKIGSHIMLWRPFISSLLYNISHKESGIIYVLFGNQAKTFRPYINHYNSIILEENHPAFYCRLGKKMSSNIFNQIDKYVKENFKEKIIWYKEE